MRPPGTMCEPRRAQMNIPVHVDGLHSFQSSRVSSRDGWRRFMPALLNRNVDMTVTKRYVGESPFDRLRVPHICDDRLPEVPSSSAT